MPQTCIVCLITEEIWEISEPRKIPVLLTQYGLTGVQYISWRGPLSPLGRPAVGGVPRRINIQNPKAPKCSPIKLNKCNENTSEMELRFSDSAFDIVHRASINHRAAYGLLHLHPIGVKRPLLKTKSPCWKNKVQYGEYNTEKNRTNIKERPCTKGWRDGTWNIWGFTSGRRDQ